MVPSDIRLLLDRHEHLENQLDRATVQPPDAGRALLCKTVQVTTYPTTAGVFYGVVQVEADGTDTEGASPSFTADASGNVFYALNLGTSIPAVGTYVICRSAGGKWCFRYG